LPVSQVTESHQSSKKDTSGTAKAIVNSFQGLGLDFDVSQVRQQLLFACPSSAAVAAFCADHG
jgi:hypothetical protein